MKTSNATDLTPYQRLAMVRAHTGHKIQLDVFEELIGVAGDDASVIILIKTAHATSSGGSYVIHRRGLKTITIGRTRFGWGRPAASIVWTEDEVKTRVVSDPPHTSSLEREEWEQLCYRPGSPTHPLDSYARQQQGYGAE